MMKQVFVTLTCLSLAIVKIPSMIFSYISFTVKKIDVCLVGFVFKYGPPNKG